MPEEIIRKLTAQLNKGITTEVQLVYLLVGIRKLIEADDQGAQYCNLKFYCDWVLHSELEGSGAQEILRAFDKARPFLKRKENLPRKIRNEINDISGMGSFEKELTRFLENYDLPPIAQNVDGWAHFFHLYTQVIQDIPLKVKSSSPDAAENISMVIVHFKAATKTFKFGDREDLPYKIVWEVFDKPGGSGRHEVHNSFDIARSYDQAVNAGFEAVPKDL